MPLLLEDCLYVNQSSVCTSLFVFVCCREVQGGSDPPEEEIGRRTAPVCVSVPTPFPVCRLPRFHSCTLCLKSWLGGGGRKWLEKEEHANTMTYGSVFGVNGPEILLSQQMTMSSPNPNP